jgi:hypothetical protein
MNDLTIQDGGALLERVIVQGDLSKLSPTERVVYYKQVCERCGLDPLMKPLEFITLNNKLVLYALRAATDQLRKLHHVSIEILNRERVDDTYLVTARATLPDGRTDESMGAVNLKGLTGDALANSYLKCETKAKRRVTLSICGLGMLDETEVDSIPGARITPSADVAEQLTREETQRVDEVAMNMAEWIAQGSIGDAVYEMENAALNAEQQIVLWTRFDSKQRSAMKREQARMKAAALAAPKNAAPGGGIQPVDSENAAGSVGAGVRTVAPAGHVNQARPAIPAVPVAAPKNPQVPPSNGDGAINAGSGTGADQKSSLPPSGPADLISPAAHKRLEARISELKLDREAVKKYVKDTFGRDHFPEMTKDEYDKLDKMIEMRALKIAKAAQTATEENGP